MSAPAPPSAAAPVPSTLAAPSRSMMAGGINKSRDLDVYDEIESMVAAPLPPPPQMQVMTATAHEGLTNTTYDIPSRCNIPSDGVGHKVTGKINSSIVLRFSLNPIKKTRFSLCFLFFNSPYYFLIIFFKPFLL